jgi:2-polyprenyl-3-methyl-5-hydroxy-6-metoxy-1,4-benzoquinol methylase
MKLAATKNSTIARPECRLCNAPLTTTFVNLGMSPLCESVLRADELDQMEPFFPLHVLVCSSCFLVQLREYVNRESIFTEYYYFSSYSTSWVEHAKRYCEIMKSKLNLDSSTHVYEIASNDGYLLQHFVRMGIPVTGIEPAANVATAAREKNVPTIVEFFGMDLARRLISEGKRADLIIGNNVLAQVPDLNDFVGGMAAFLSPEGVITLEFPHLERLISENQFDTIYHEHFSYFSFVTIDRLAKDHGLKTFDVEHLSTHGGSLRVYLCRKNASHTTSPRVDALLTHERQIGFENMTMYSNFSDQVHRTKRQLLLFLIGLKERGAKVCGYGAPGKGNTLLNYCAIGVDFLNFTVDRNPHKHGLYTPGMHIPIRPISAINDERPDYLLILPWNLKKEIIDQMRYVGDWGCKFIVAIPKI